MPIISIYLLIYYYSSTIGLEIKRIELFTYQHAIGDVQLEGELALGLEANGEQFDVSLEGLLITEVNERGIEGLLAIGMQAIVGEVAHGLHALASVLRYSISCGL